MLPCLFGLFGLLLNFDRKKEDERRTNLSLLELSASPQLKTAINVANSRSRFPLTYVLLLNSEPPWRLAYPWARRRCMGRRRRSRRRPPPARGSRCCASPRLQGAESNGRRIWFIQGFLITRSVGFSEAWFWFSLGLVGRTTTAIQPRQVVYSSTNSNPTDMNEWP